MVSVELVRKDFKSLAIYKQTDILEKWIDAQVGVWGNIPWKFELNPFISLAGDVLTSLHNANKTDQFITYVQTDGHTYWKNNG